MILMRVLLLPLPLFQMSLIPLNQAIKLNKQKINQTIQLRAITNGNGLFLLLF